MPIHHQNCRPVQWWLTLFPLNYIILRWSPWVPPSTDPWTCSVGRRGSPRTACVCISACQPSLCPWRCTRPASEAAGGLPRPHWWPQCEDSTPSAASLGQTAARTTTAQSTTSSSATTTIRHSPIKYCQETWKRKITLWNSFKDGKLILILLRVKPISCWLSWIKTKTCYMLLYWIYCRRLSISLIEFDELN